jgi:peptidoglycan hydrolase-like protein with peptidoglycan-binding domain
VPEDENTGWYPEGFVNPADDPAIDWIVPATDEDPVPPPERLAEEPVTVTVDTAPEEDRSVYLAPELQGGEASFPAVEDGEAGPRQFVQPGFGGLNLSDYSRNPQQKGWGAPCSAARATVRLSAAAVTVDARIAELTGLIMRACEAHGYIFRAADTGAYNCRYISGTTVWSNHAWALAVDVNWQSNPYTTRVGATDIPEWMHNLWNRYGFAWGGDYTGGKRDYMHFEFMGTPQQANQALALARAELGGIVGPTPVPAPTPAPAPGQWFDIPAGGVTSLNARGGQVAQDQRDLIDSGFTVGAGGADGYAGADTVAAIRLAQFALKVGVDGEMGPATRDAIHRIPSYGLPAGHVWGPITGPAWQHGGINASERAQVQRYQGQLIRKGYATTTRNPAATGWDDGRYENATTEATKRLQRAEGLGVDGLAGPVTWTRSFV